MSDSKIILVQEEPRGPSQLIEVPVLRAGQQRVYFPDIQQLRSMEGLTIIIKKLRLIVPEVYPRGMINGFVNAPYTELVKMALVLYCEGWEKGYGIPILTLNDVAIPGTATPNRFEATRFDNWVSVDWTKSYLQYANGTSSVLADDAPYTVIIDAEYQRLGSDNQPIKGAR